MSGEDQARSGNDKKDREITVNKSSFVRELFDGIRKSFESCSSCDSYDDYQKQEKKVLMRDGIGLQTRIYIPKKSDRTEPEQIAYPVILQRSCYPMMEPLLHVYGEELSKKGYVYVYQYCRGIAGSEGIWEPNIHERNDGIDTVTWLKQQSWADAIGVWGDSYGALVGWAMADAVKESVASMCIGVYGCDRFVSAYQKGSFRHDILTSWTMDNAGFPIEADYLESCRYMPQEQVDEKLWGRRIEWYRDYIRNTQLTDDYWQSGWWRELREIPERVEIPLFIASGWYDHHHGSTMVTWERLNDKAKEHSWLEIGGWNHHGMSCLSDREVKNNNKNAIKCMMDWFDLTLKEKKLPEQKVRLYEIGRDSWLKLENLSDVRTEDICYYLDVKDGRKTLTAFGPTIESQIRYLYDPKNPVMSHGAESLLKTMSEVGSLLQPEPDWREDVLSFLSEPLTQELRIFGKIKVELFVASDCEDTSFTAKVMEVRPEGKAYNIRSSITTIASDQKNNELYKPGMVTTVVIDMWDIFYTLPIGSRLRVDISSSDFPQYNIHSNYIGNWAQQKETKVAQQTILCGKDYPSKLILPYIKP